MRLRGDLVFLYEFKLLTIFKIKYDEEINISSHVSRPTSKTNKYNFLLRYQSTSAGLSQNSTRLHFEVEGAHVLLSFSLSLYLQSLWLTPMYSRHPLLK